MNRALHDAVESQVDPAHLEGVLDRLDGVVALQRLFAAGAFSPSQSVRRQLRAEIAALDSVIGMLEGERVQKVDLEPLKMRRRHARTNLGADPKRSGPADREDLAIDVLEALADTRGGGLETIRPGQSPEGKKLRADAAVVAIVLKLAGLEMADDSVHKLVRRIVRGKI